MARRRIDRMSIFAYARARVAREARKTRAGLWLEAAARAFWPVWAVTALALGLMMLGVPAALPREWHIALIAAFAAALVFFAARGAWNFRAPTQAQALARLDRGAPGRPAESLDDGLAGGGGDEGTEALWAAHQRIMAERAAALKAKAPDLRVSELDPFALRHGALIVLAAGMIGYFGGDAPDLADQLRPAPAEAGPAVAAASLEAWATPPVYTRAAPVYLSRVRKGERLRLPQGTEISLRVFDSKAAPQLRQSLTDAEAAFADMGAEVYEATFPLTVGGEVRVTLDGEEMGAWSIEMIPDAPPEIAFDGEIAATAGGAMVLPYRASDDYGVRSAVAVIRLDPDAPPPVEGAIRPSLYEPIELDLPMPLTGDARDVAERLVENLSEHPWAGLPVIVTIRAEDAAGQTAEAATRAVLPGRVFTHPMARALIEQRRHLAFSPDAAPRVLDVLEAVMLWPEEVFDDMTGYLAARMAVRRLTYALEDGRLEAESPSIVDLLWKAAIRLEDGDLASAAERLARAQERLQQAIENGASEDEIARLMDELRQAMQEYLAEMAREAQRDAQNGRQQQQQQGEMRELTQQDLERMLQDLEDALRNGQMDLARQMLQALQEMMQNLQMAQPGQGQQGHGQQMLNEMGDMIGEQQGLADRSFDQMRRNGRQGRGRQGRDGQAGEGEPGDETGRIARDQEALRQLLEDLRGRLPGAAGEGTRRALDEADRAMGEAAEALRQGDPRDAVDDQIRALEALREGRNEMARDLAEAQGQANGRQAGRDSRGGDAREEDPFGRPRAAEGPMDGDSTRVPGVSLGKRARELQDEIRRRAGERQRPAEELDYLERLLDRF